MVKEIRSCSECDSEYFIHTSKMTYLCPDCSHFLYGYPNCEHEFKNERCSLCHWNGISSDYVNSIKAAVLNEWTPISLSELQSEIDSGIEKMTPQQLKIWQGISITPEKWHEEEYGKEGGGFWVVAIKDFEVIWYNDIEEGFNTSIFHLKGKINDYEESYN